MPAQKTNNKNLSQQASVQTQAQVIEPEKELFSWKAPSRPFQKRSREFWTKLIITASIFGLIIYLAEGVMPVILIIAVIFLFYVMSNVEPEEILYKITNRGIKIADKTTDMSLLTRFWFTKRFNSDLIVFETLFLPGRLELVINNKDKEKIKDTLSIYLIEEEVPPSNIDKAVQYFSSKFPAN